MSTPFQALKIAEDIYWVGAVDWTIRDFHGYSTSRGTTYNAFLVLGEKVTLIDAVKAHFKEEMLSRIASVIDPKRIDYIVSNHAELDHSGCIPDLIELIQPEKVFASTLGVPALKAHFHGMNSITPVKDGEEILISPPGAKGGPLTLKFLETRFLHWPDSMFSYLCERKILFSQDAFGMHLASFERFSRNEADWLLEHEAAKYFANILLPFSHLILKLLEKVESLGLEIDMVAPDHGPIWQEDFPKVLGWYKRWAVRAPLPKAVIVYDTMWESTELMARVIGDGIASTGAQVKLLPLAGSHRSDVATEILDAGALLVGSPTLNNQIFPTVMDVLTYIKGLKPKNLFGAAFGSFGWSGEATKHLDALLEEMGIENLGSLRANYVPKDELLISCRALGIKVGERLTRVAATASTSVE